MLLSMDINRLEVAEGGYHIPQVGSNFRCIAFCFAANESSRIMESTTPTPPAFRFVSIYVKLIYLEHRTA
jgi:hypothetical protein